MVDEVGKVDAKQVSKAKALATQRARDIELLTKVEADPGLFAADAAKTLEARIDAANTELTSLPQEVRAKALTPGQLNELVSGEMEKAVRAWYPGAFASACKNVNVSEQAVASKDTLQHNVTILGTYDHKSKRLVKRLKLQKIVTIGRKGLS